MLETVWAFVQIIGIDVIMAADNAAIVAMIAMTVPLTEQRRVLVFGTGLAVALRVGLAVFASFLMQYVGLTLAGGFILLYFAHGMYKEMCWHGTTHGGTKYRYKSFRHAVLQIGIADTVMSIDNVLAVSGIANGHVQMTAFGLLLSVALMGAAAGFLAHTIQRYRWIAWVGLAMVGWVALSMIWKGGIEVVTAAAAATMR
ncbi:MAG: YjbE family putative metal transport protein [Patescibacteria group bacterium]